MHSLIESTVNGLRYNMPYSNTLHDITHILAQIVQIPEDFAASWHPYGFLVLKLGTFEGITLRLHIWPEGPRTRQVPDWPVHSHPWTLHSRILCGTLINEFYKVSPDPLVGNSCMYQVKYQNNLSVLEKTNIRATCTLLSQVEHRAGQDYYVAADEYHATEVPQEMFASTIVVTEGQSNSSPYVVGEFEYNDSYFYERRVCNSSTLRSLVIELQSRIYS